MRQCIKNKLRNLKNIEELIGLFKINNLYFYESFLKSFKITSLWLLCKKSIRINVTGRRFQS